MSRTKQPEVTVNTV